MSFRLQNSTFGQLFAFSHELDIAGTICQGHSENKFDEEIGNIVCKNMGFPGLKKKLIVLDDEATAKPG